MLTYHDPYRACVLTFEKIRYIKYWMVYIVKQIYDKILMTLQILMHFWYQQQGHAEIKSLQDFLCLLN